LTQLVDQKMNYQATNIPTLVPVTMAFTLEHMSSFTAVVHGEPMSTQRRMQMVECHSAPNESKCSIIATEMDQNKDLGQLL
jgi:hypothetical protein